MNRLKDLRERQASLVTAGEEILKDATENGWDDERQANFDRTHTDLGEVQKSIDAVVSQRAASAAAAERVDSSIDRSADTGDRALEDHQRMKKDDPFFIDRLMFKFVRSGFEEFTPEDRQQYAIHCRQQATTPDADGGFVVGEEFMKRIEDALLMFAGIRNIATVLRTATGEPLHFPTSDGTAEVGEIIDENAAHNTEDVVFAELVLNAFQYSSKMIKSSRQLLQDSFVPDLVGFFANRLGERIGRIQATHFTVGAGTTEPFGIVTQSTNVHTTLAAAITYDDLVDLVHATEPAYANSPNTRFGFNWTTLGAFRKLSDLDGFPIWSPVAAEQPATLLGYSYQILQDMADVASATVPVIFGDMSKYIIRDAGGMNVFRSEHRFFELNQIAWLAILRSDANLLDAGTNPITNLTMLT